MAYYRDFRPVWFHFPLGAALDMASLSSVPPLTFLFKGLEFRVPEKYSIQSTILYVLRWKRKSTVSLRCRAAANHAECCTSPQFVCGQSHSSYYFSDYYGYCLYGKSYSKYPYPPTALALFPPLLHRSRPPPKFELVVRTAQSQRYWHRALF